VTEVLLTLTEVFLTLTEGFPCFFLSCKANAKAKLAKTGHGPHSSTLVVICVVRLLFMLFYVLFVCKCVLPSGGNPSAVNKYINTRNEVYIFWLIALVLWSTARVLHSWFRIPTNGMNVATPAFSCICVLCVANDIEMDCAPVQIVL
jgi:hypothetical protein